MPLSSAGLVCRAGLAGGEEVSLASAFLSHDLFLQVLGGFAMLPVE